MKDFGQLQSDVERVRLNRLEDRLTPKIPFPHKHDFYHVLVIEKGRGWHEIDFVRHVVQKNQVFFMKPDQAHSWSLDDRTKGYVLEFETSALGSLPFDENERTSIRQALPDCFELTTGQMKEVAGLCRLLESELKLKNPAWQTMLRLHLGVLLGTFLRLFPASARPNERKEALFQNFSRLVEENFRQEHGVEFYAAKLGVPVKTLTMRLTRAAGISPRQVIQDRCLLEAKRLLAYSENSVSQIAEDLGFEDANYFGRFFRSKEDQTPGDFRKKVRVS